MNRKIIFRGKNTFTKEWVYGDLIQLPNVTAIKEVNGYYLHPTVVDKDTVSQYIGLEDINGDLIFEGDIIESDGNQHIIKYDEKSASFRAVLTTDKNYSCAIDQQWINECEKVIIGNIIDTPELTI